MPEAAKPTALPQREIGISQAAVPEQKPALEHPFELEQVAKPLPVMDSRSASDPAPSAEPPAEERGEVSLEVPQATAPEKESVVVSEPAILPFPFESAGHSSKSETDSASLPLEPPGVAEQSETAIRVPSPHDTQPWEIEPPKPFPYSTASPAAARLANEISEVASEPLEDGPFGTRRMEEPAPQIRQVAISQISPFQKGSHTTVDLEVVSDSPVTPNPAPSRSVILPAAVTSQTGIAADMNPFARHAAGQEHAQGVTEPTPSALPPWSSASTAQNQAPGSKRPTATGTTGTGVSKTQSKRRSSAGRSTLQRVASWLIFTLLLGFGVVKRDRVASWWKEDRPHLITKFQNWLNKPTAKKPADPTLYTSEKWNLTMKLPEGWQWLHPGGGNRLFTAAKLGNANNQIVVRGGVVGTFAQTGEQLSPNGLQAIMLRQFARLVGPQNPPASELQVGPHHYTVYRVDDAPGCEYFRGQPVSRALFQNLRNDVIYSFEFIATGAQAKETLTRTASQFLEKIGELTKGLSVSGQSRRVDITSEHFAEETGFRLANLGDPEQFTPLQDGTPLLPLVEEEPGKIVRWNLPVDPLAASLVGGRDSQGNLVAVATLFAPEKYFENETALVRTITQAWIPGGRLNLEPGQKLQLNTLQGRSFEGQIQWDGAPHAVLLSFYRQSNHVHLALALAAQKGRPPQTLAPLLAGISYTPPPQALEALGSDYIPPVCLPLQSELWLSAIQQAEAAGRAQTAQEITRDAWQHTRDGRILHALCRQLYSEGGTAAKEEATRRLHDYLSAPASCSALGALAVLAAEHAEPSLAVTLMRTSLQHDPLGRSATGIPGARDVVDHLARKRHLTEARALVDTYQSRQTDAFWKMWEAHLLYQEPKTKAKGVETLERWVGGRSQKGFARQLIEFVRRQNAYPMGQEVANRVLSYQQGSPLAWLLKVICLRGLNDEAGVAKALTEARQANPRLTSLEEMAAALTGEDAGAILPGQSGKVPAVTLPEALESSIAKTLIAPVATTSGTGWSYLYKSTAIAADASSNGRTTTRVGIILHDTDGMKSFNTLRLPFHPKSERMQLHDLKVTLGGKLQSSPADLLKAFVADKTDQTSAAEERVLVVPVPGLAVGAVLEYSYTREILIMQPGELTLRHVFGNNTPTGLEILYLEKPSADLAHQHSRDQPPRQAGAGIYWMEQDLPPLDRPYFQAPQDKLVPVVWTGARNHTWQNVAEEYGEILQPALRMDESIRRTAIDLTGNCRNNAEKIAALSKFVRETISYSGLQMGAHALEPHPAGETIRNRYGDCKDHSVLLHQLCSAVGIPSSIALCNVDTDVPKALPSLGAFNHMVVAVPGAKDGYWDFIDTTNKRLSYSAGQVPWLLGERHALVLGNRSASGSKLVMIPGVSRPEQVLITREVRPAGGDGADSLTVKDIISCTGLAACELRWRLDAFKETPTATSLARLFGLDRSLLPIKSAQVENQESEEKPLLITLQYEVRRGLQRQGASLLAYLPSRVETRLLDPEEMLSENFDSAYFEFPLQITTKTHFTLPTDWSCAAATPQPTTGSHITCTIQREVQPTHLTIQSHVTRSTREITSRKDYEAFQTEILNALAPVESIPLVAPSSGNIGTEPSIAEK